MKIDKVLVYVAGPLTVGDVEQNIRNAMEMGTKLLEQGFNVIIPHLNIFLERYWQSEGYDIDYGYEEWLALDFGLLAKCDLMLKMPGESPGAEQERAFALGRGIPVCYTLSQLLIERDKLRG